MNTSHVIAVLVVLAVGSFAFYFPSHLGRHAEQQAQLRMQVEQERAEQAEQARLEALEAEVAGYQDYLQAAQESKSFADETDTTHWPTTVRVLLQQLVSKIPDANATANELIDLADLLRAAEPSPELQQQYAKLRSQFEQQSSVVEDLQDRFEMALSQHTHSPGATLAVNFLEFGTQEAKALGRSHQAVENWLAEQGFQQVVEAQSAQNRLELEESLRRYQHTYMARSAALSQLQELAKLIVAGVEGQLGAFKEQLTGYPTLVRAMERERSILATGFAFMAQMHKPGMVFDWQALRRYQGDAPLIPELDIPQFSRWEGNDRWDVFLLRVDRELKKHTRQSHGSVERNSVSIGPNDTELESRQKLFRKITELERRAATTAVIQFPTDAARQSELENRLRERYLEDLSRSYGKSRDQLQAIYTEGVNSGWDF